MMSVFKALQFVKTTGNNKLVYTVNMNGDREYIVERKKIILEPKFDEKLQSNINKKSNSKRTICSKKLVFDNPESLSAYLSIALMGKSTLLLWDVDDNTISCKFDCGNNDDSFIVNTLSLLEDEEIKYKKDKNNDDS